MLSFKKVSDKEFYEKVDLHFKEAFSNRQEAPILEWLSTQEVENIKKLRSNLKSLYSMHVLVYLDSELIGWHVGEQINAETYYMRNSAILKPFRGNSYYGQLLKFVINEVQSNGFQIISSTHHPNNPAVLIPKLRSGFIITSTEMSDRFGFLVHLKYFVNKKREKEFFKRIGLE